MLPALHRDCISVSRDRFKLSFERAVCGDFECVLAVCKRYRLAVQRYGFHTVAAVWGHCERYFCAALIIGRAGRYRTMLAAVHRDCIPVSRNCFECGFKRAVSGDGECVLAVGERNCVSVQGYGLHAVAAVRGDCNRNLCAVVVSRRAGRYRTMLAAVHRDCIPVSRNCFECGFKRAVSGDGECVLAVGERNCVSVQGYGLHAVAAVRSYCKRNLRAVVVSRRAGCYRAVFAAAYGHDIGIRRYFHKFSRECGIAFDSEYILVAAVQRNLRAVQRR